MSSSDKQNRTGCYDVELRLAEAENGTIPKLSPRIRLHLGRPEVRNRGARISHHI